MIAAFMNDVFMKLWNWLGEDAMGKRAGKYKNPPLLAYYWEGAESTAHPLKEISSTGAFICTKDRWYAGTVITFVLQQKYATEGAFTIAVNGKVVQQGTDGITVSFVFEKPEDQKALERFLAASVARAPVVMVRRTSEGQALVEFALMVPFLFFLIINTVNLGMFIYACIQVADAARAGADYGVLGCASQVGAPNPSNPPNPPNPNPFCPSSGPEGPSVGQIQALVRADLSSLPNSGAASISVISPGPDPEPGYVSLTVDVTYPYAPLIPSFNFPSLGIGLPAMPNSIHRRAVMRMLQ